MCIYFLVLISQIYQQLIWWKSGYYDLSLASYLAFILGPVLFYSPLFIRFQSQHRFSLVTTPVENFLQNKIVFLKKPQWCHSNIVGVLICWNRWNNIFLDRRYCSLVVQIVLKNKGLGNECSSTKRAWHVCVSLTFYLYLSFLLKRSVFSRTFNFFCL